METIAIRISPNVQAVKVGGLLVELPPEAVEAIREIVDAVLEPDPDPGKEAPLQSEAA